MVDPDAARTPRSARLSRRQLYTWGAVVGALAYILVAVGVFFAASWPQTYYYPYDVPAGQLTLGQGLLILTGVVGGFSLVFLAWVGARLFRGRGLPGPARALTGLMGVGFAIGGSVLVVFTAERVPFWWYDAGPYLTWDVDQDPARGITVCWHSGPRTPSRVTYGTDPVALNRTARGDGPAGWSQFHHVRLDALAPNTTYFYRVSGWPVKNFTTAPAGSHAFTFCAWSDPRTNNGYDTAVTRPNLPAAMARDLAAQGVPPAFSLCTGDITERGVDFETWKLWLEDITTADWASNASHQVAIGNHERHDDCTGRNMRDYYPYQVYNYSFTYGDLHVTVLDPWDYEECWWNAVPADQLAWLARDLQRHNASAFKVVALHPSYFYFGRFHYNFEAFHAVCQAGGVDVVISGHTHHYEVSRLDDVLYCVIGIGGNRNFGGYHEASTEARDAGAVLLDAGHLAAGYLQVDVTPACMHVRPRLINGTWLRSYVVPAPA